MTKAQLFTAILDAVGAILGIWIGTLVDEKTAQQILLTYAALQPVLLGVLALISYDKKAKMEASSRAAMISATREARIGKDEWGAMLTEAYERGMEAAKYGV